MPSEMSGLQAIGPVVFMLVAAVFAGVFALRSLRALAPSAAAAPESDPLSALFQPGTFENQIRETASLFPDRSRMGPHAGAILRSRIDHAGYIQQIWGHETREEAIRRVASVMRKGLRQGDNVSHLKGDGFVIHIPGVNETEATGIANRLRRSLARATIDAMGRDYRVTASFGVAGRKAGETNAALHQRADNALNTAQYSGEDHIVAASDIEEVIMLPAPSEPVELPIGDADSETGGKSAAA